MTSDETITKLIIRLRKGSYDCDLVTDTEDWAKLLSGVLGDLAEISEQWDGAPMITEHADIGEAVRGGK